MVADGEPQRCGTIAEVHKGDRKHPVGPIRATLEILLWTAMGANLSDPALEAKFPTAPNIRKPLMRTCWRSPRFTAGSGGQPSIYPSGRHLFEFVYCLVGCAHYGRSIRYMQVYPCTTRAAETSRAAAMTMGANCCIRSMVQRWPGPVIVRAATTTDDDSMIGAETAAMPSPLSPILA